MTTPQTFRQQIVQKFTAEFGVPEVCTVESGEIYRWTLHRGPYDVSMFITLDCPEFSDIAQTMISDSTRQQVAPVVAVTVRSLDEADGLIARIIQQWKPPRRSSP